MGSTRALASRAHARGRNHNLGRSRVEREVTTITPHLRSALEATGSAAQCTTPRSTVVTSRDSPFGYSAAKFLEALFLVFSFPKAVGNRNTGIEDREVREQLRPRFRSNATSTNRGHGPRGIGARAANCAPPSLPGCSAGKAI